MRPFAPLAGHAPGEHDEGLLAKVAPIQRRPRRAVVSVLLRPQGTRVRAQASYAAIAGRRARHAASASPIGVDGGAWVKGQISSAMARQLAVAMSSPRTANRPRLMRCRMT